MPNQFHINVIRAFALTIFLGLFSIQSKADYQGLGQGSVSPDVIKKYEAPILEPALSRKIQTWADIRSPGGGILHPNGKSLYFTWTITGTRQIWMQDGPNHFPKQITAGEDATSIQGISPDGKKLYVTRDRNGEENPGLYFISAEQPGELELIQHLPKIQTHLGAISDDSNTLYLVANKEREDSYAIYAYDVNKKNQTLLFNEEGNWDIADYREHTNPKSGAELLIVKNISNVRREYYLFNVATKIKTPVIGIGDEEEYSAVFASKSGNNYFVESPKNGQYRAIYSFDTETKLLKPMSKSGVLGDISISGIDQERTRLYTSWNDRGYSRLQVYDTKTMKLQSLPNIKGADHTFGGTISKNGNLAVIQAEFYNQPRTSFVYDWKTKNLTRWVFPSSPEMNATKMVPYTLEYADAKDGTKIPLFVKRPKACLQPNLKQPCPVLVDFHGGPESQSTPGFSPTVEIFTEAGFIFIMPNVRGSDGYGKDWLNADNGPRRLNVITDIEDVGLFIKKHFSVGGVVPKVGITGGSYGGYSTLFAMTKYAGTYDAGVARVGMSNLVSFLQNTAPYRRKLRMAEYGDLEKDRDALVKLSPITYVDQVKSPLLIIQGVNDPRVPAGEAIQIQETLTKKGIPSELILFADEGHGAAKRSNQVLSTGHTLRFFKEHLMK